MVRGSAQPSPPRRPRSRTSLTQTSDVAGIVLAGGRSSRFGRDKLAEPYRGRPLLHHPVSALTAVCHEVTVVVPPDVEGLDLPPGRIHLAHDSRPHEGPLAGLVAGLVAIDAKWALVAAGDQPGLRPVLLAAMAKIAQGEDVDAVALLEGETLRPLPCVIRTSRHSTAKSILKSGEGGVRALLEALGTRRVPEVEWRTLDPTAAWTKDVDVPEDLEG